MSARSDAAPRAWVVGGGGLLGSAVRRALLDAEHEPIDPRPVPWKDEDAAAQVLVEELAVLLSAAPHAEWAVYWCAGAGITSTSREMLDQELRTFRRFCDALAELGADDLGRGRLFLASSAGGVYGGSADPPFSERTPPVPASPYGETKLAMEDAARRLAGSTGLPVILGRIANLYGPGQDLSKPQGLISQLARAALTGEPLPLFADPATTRDYLFVDDCATLVVGLLWSASARTVRGRAETVVLCSGTSTTIAEVLDLFERITGSRPPVRVPAEVPARQTIDLRLESEAGGSLPAADALGLEEGARRVIDALRGDPDQSRRSSPVR